MPERVASNSVRTEVIAPEKKSETDDGSDVVQRTSFVDSQKDENVGIQSEASNSDGEEKKRAEPALQNENADDLTCAKKNQEKKDIQVSTLRKSSEQPSNVEIAKLQAQVREIEANVIQKQVPNHTDSGAGMREHNDNKKNSTLTTNKVALSDFSQHQWNEVYAQLSVKGILQTTVFKLFVHRCGWFKRVFFIG